MNVLLSLLMEWKGSQQADVNHFDWHFQREINTHSWNWRISRNLTYSAGILWSKYVHIRTDRKTKRWLTSFWCDIHTKTCDKSQTECEKCTKHVCTIWRKVNKTKVFGFGLLLCLTSKRRSVHVMWSSSRCFGERQQSVFWRQTTVRVLETDKLPLPPTFS